MVVIRLKRMGSHKSPFYRLVAADSRNRRDGRFIEELGYYNPLTVPHKLEINKESLLKWMQNGAQLSDTVKGLVKPLGILKEFHSENVEKSKKRKEQQK